jgi:GTP-binding protein HflX
VGFISDLPHELVEAFRATLEEVKEADVILHVRDIASADSDAEAADVREVLQRLGVEMAERRVIEVWNKADRLDPEAREERRTDAVLARPAAVLVSAVSGEGCEALLARIAGLIDEAPPVVIHAAAGQGDLVAWLYRHGRVLERREAEDGSVALTVSLSDQAQGQLERLFPGVGVLA